MSRQFEVGEGEAQAARNLILALLRAAGGCLGKVQLHKAFYLAHTEYLEETGLTLTNWPIVHATFGPGIRLGDDLLADLIRGESIGHKMEMRGSHPTNVYALLEGAPDTAYDEIQRHAIESAAETANKHTATELSDMTHTKSLAWLDAKPGEELDLTLDVMGPTERSRVQDSAQKIAEIMRGLES